MDGLGFGKEFLTGVTWSSASLVAAGEFAVVQLLEFPDQEKSALDLDFLLFVD